MERLEPAGFFVLRTPLLALAELAGDLRALARRPEVERAIALASPALAAALPELGPAVERYLARAASRPTPFGLFAGITLGSIDRATALELAPRAEWRRASALDLDWLEALAARAEDALGRALPLAAAPSLAWAGGRAIAL